MKYSDLRTTILAQFLAPQGHRIVPVIKGKPGGGKSALSRDVMHDPALGLQLVIEFNGSLREPADILGIPFKSDDGTHSKWLPPEEMWMLQHGRVGLILEEYSDATVAMQNAECRVIYDRYAGQLKLSDTLFIIGTGNRTEDKSGANRVTSKFHNRVRQYMFDENIDDWADWALNKGIDVILIQFLRFRPNLLSDFVPDRAINPTPRKWEDVSLIPSELPTNLYFESVAGDVGEGAAAEYTGFRRIYEGLPNIDGIIMNPAKADVPKDPAVLYALTGALAHRVSKDNFDRVSEYTQRLPSDFQVMCINDALKLKPEIKQTKAFVQFAVRNSNLLI
jgi:hypothetical protein